MVYSESVNWMICESYFNKAVIYIHICIYIWHVGTKYTFGDEAG